MSVEGKGGKRKGAPKTGGRKKGTPNKVTSDLRARIAAFLDERWEDAVEAWGQIDSPASKVRLYIDLASFCLPRMQSISMDATVMKKESSVEDDLKELSQDEEEG